MPWRCAIRRPKLGWPRFAVRANARNRLPGKHLATVAIAALSTRPAVRTGVSLCMRGAASTVRLYIAKRGIRNFDPVPSSITGC